MKFKQLMIDSYKKYLEGKNIIGYLYNPISNVNFSSFSNLEDFEAYINKFNPDMLYLKSLLTDAEVDVYESNFIDYKIKHSETTIYIKLNNKPEIGIMY